MEETSEQVAQGIADEKLDELADLLAHWQRNRAKGITPCRVRAAIFTSIGETQLVSSLRAQVATLTEKVERLRGEAERWKAETREADELFKGACFKNAALRADKLAAEAERDKYKANLDELRRDYRLFARKG